ncbi:hypothetical protein [Paenibacillus sp. DMB20]|uniref:hypothetical protein n=1 Tax=Paenibacillus sp. DMB20 TaxID=1642570 RepID=UPI001F41BAD2|nr:hypothetical protein [Paenibacillus sp. DMB20]
MLQSGLYTDFTWSRNHVAASGTNQVYLLVEWRGMPGQPRNDNLGFRPVAGRIQLHLQLGAGVRLAKVYGCKAEMLNDRSFTFILGSLWQGMEKQIVLGFELTARPSGVYPVVTALWTYEDEREEQVVVSSITQSLQFSNHTAVLNKMMDKRVEKYLKLLQNPAVLENALRAFERGCYERGEEIIRRRADEMLLYAARLNDGDYLKEAELLYGLGSRFMDTYASVAAV